jgi:predicted nucleotidyltransferase
MLNKKTLELLGAWRENILAEYSVSEIREKLSLQYRQNTYTYIKQLVEEGIVVIHERPNMNTYSLNLKNPLAITTINYFFMQSYLVFPRKDIIEIILDRTKNFCCCILIFGSYAKGTNQKKSDLDLCFLIQNKTVEQDIIPIMREIQMDELVELDVHYITFSDFMKMLSVKSENLGKQIFRGQLILQNPNIYYNLVLRAEENGIKI